MTASEQLQRVGRRKHVLLSGDFVNLGDAFLTLIAVRHLQSMGGRVTALPYRRPHAEMLAEFHRAGCRVYSIREQPIRALFAALGADVWIGGGHVIRDHVSFGWLLGTNLIARLARATGNSIQVVGAGASALPTRWKRGLFKSILTRCHRICVRDETSATLVRETFPSLSGRLVLTGDLAFLAGTTLITEASESGRCVISLAVDQSEARDYSHEEILEALRRLGAEHGVSHVTLVPHDLRPISDIDGCQAMAENIRAQTSMPVEVVTSEDVESGLLTPYRKAEWIVTARLHGLIVGALLGKKVIYTRNSTSKLAPFATYFGHQRTDSAHYEPASEASGHPRPGLLHRLQRAAAANFLPVQAKQDAARTGSLERSA